ncbi:MAG: 1-acyl-sn-glycerol-3-phosphate acyltransferase [Anaerolineae bacterium]|nr:1-acyl-sn-glycerol-3-phosphate acyltransferase [Anaerolineae bacterium]
MFLQSQTYPRSFTGMNLSWENFIYELGRPLVNLGAQTLFKLDVVWRAAMPVGPKIITPNHPSTTDPFLIAMLFSEPVHTLIDERLFKVPLFGRFLHNSGQVPVVRDNGRASYERARQYLEAGQTVAIFPEGAISPLEGGVHAPHTGAARLALSTGAPLIPVGIHLQRERIHLIETRIEGETEIGTWYLRGPYSITIGQPLHLNGSVENREYVREVSKTLMQHIVQLADESERRMHTATRRRKETKPSRKTAPVPLP